MRMRRFMHKNVITVPSDAPILEAQKIMHEHRIRRLPVTEGGKLVGLLTERDMREAIMPFTGGNISTWEFNYMLSRMKVKDAMVKNVITVTPDTPVEEALSLGPKHKIDTWIVVDKEKVVGILSTTDLLYLMSNVFGFGSPGIRLHVHGCGKGEPVRKILDTICAHKGNIQTIYRFKPEGAKKEDVIIHLEPMNATPIVKELKAQGYEVEASKVKAIPLEGTRKRKG